MGDADREAEAIGDLLFQGAGIGVLVGAGGRALARRFRRVAEGLGLTDGKPAGDDLLRGGIRVGQGSDRPGMAGADLAGAEILLDGRREFEEAKRIGDVRPALADYLGELGLGILEVVDQLTAEPSLRSYYLLPNVRGDLLFRLGRLEEARQEFERAAELAPNARQKTLLQTRARKI